MPCVFRPNVTYVDFNIALIIPACPSLQSVSFSGPGWVYSQEQYETEFRNDTGTHQRYPQQEHARNLAAIFMPKNDFVPFLDRHVGTIYHTDCHHDDPLSCHSMNEMVCELLRSCGDGQNQKRFRNCGNDEFVEGTDDNFDSISKFLNDFFLQSE